jgi:dihydroorotate dehydrogenase/NAD-dependent dihydropyrimidine dehydrogenase PreA subunit
MSTEFLGWEMQSPLILAPGAQGTRNAEQIIQAAKAGVGAVIAEGAAPEGCVIPKPWLVYTRGGLLNSTSYSMFTREDWFKREIPKAKKAGIPIIIGVNARFGIDEMIKTTHQATEAGVDALTSSANEPSTAAEHIKIIREETHLPVMVKIGFSNAMETIGKPIEDVGVNAITAIDAPWGLRINTETGKPANGGLNGLGHFSGYPMLPMAIYSIYMLSRTVSIPIIGNGGMRTGSDLAEMMMAGAQVGATCTEIILSGGLKRIKGILEELSAVMDHHELDSVSDLVGMGTEYLKNRRPEDIETGVIPPDVDPEKCTACGDCVTACSWDAITLDDVAEIHVDDCTGCALCVSICRYHAISLNYWQPVRGDHRPVQWK